MAFVFMELQHAELLTVIGRLQLLMRMKTCVQCLSGADLGFKEKGTGRNRGSGGWKSP